MRIPYASTSIPSDPSELDGRARVDAHPTEPALVFSSPAVAVRVELGRAEALELALDLLTAVGIAPATTLRQARVRLDVERRLVGR